MRISICGAPCCWGVDDVKNPYNPPWQRVLREAGRRAIGRLSSARTVICLRTWERFLMN